MIVRGLLVIGCAVCLAGCVSGPPTTGSSKVTPSAALEGKGAAVEPVVDKVGAAVTVSGYVVFALVRNPSARQARDVVVQVSATDAMGSALGSRDGRILRIAAGSTQAAAIDFPATASLPAGFTGTVKSLRWDNNAGQPSLIEVLNAGFLPAPQFPTVRVQVRNHGDAAKSVSVTVVCFDNSGQLRGGGSKAVTVDPSVASIDVVVQVAVPDMPASCQSIIAEP